jgi:hypothetical protein
MPTQLVSAAPKAPSIVVILGAYETFFAQTEKEFTARYLDEAVGFARSAEPETIHITPSDVEPWLRFQSLAGQWRMQRGARSSITQAALSPAYQSIIGMGPMAVQFIIIQLESEGDEPDQWFWALKAITGADPVRDEDRGDYVAMARSWLQWAKDQGHAR